MKILKPIILFCILFLLSSCSPGNKDEAYCFSTVFEKNGGTQTVTMHCKTENKEDSSKLSDSSFTFVGKTMEDAILSAQKSDYEIYFSSTKAVYFSPDITKEEIFEIVLYFLNHAKFQSSVSIYTPENIKNNTTDKIHSEAKSVCKNEKISFSKQKDYTFAIKAVRDMQN